MKYFKSRADSGNAIERGFCPNCGSQLFTRLQMMPDVLGLRAGTLDAPENFEPTLDMYTASAPYWDQMNPALLKFPAAPTM